MVDFLFEAADDAGKPTKKPIMSVREDMIPIFKERCGDCHQPDGAGLKESGLGVQIYAELMKGIRARFIQIESIALYFPLSYHMILSEKSTNFSGSCSRFVPVVISWCRGRQSNGNAGLAGRGEDSHAAWGEEVFELRPQCIRRWIEEDAFDN